MFDKDFDLKDQLSRSSSRVAPLIAEGYGQLTDRHLAVYLGRARGSVLETITHLGKALNEQFITAAEHSTLLETYDHRQDADAVDQTPTEVWLERSGLIHPESTMDDQRSTMDDQYP